MTKKIKYMFIILIMFISIISLYNKEKNVYALSNPYVYVIYNKTSLDVDDEVEIEINFKNFENVNEIKMGINNSKLIEPLQINEKYINVNNKCAYTKEIYNAYENNNLRIHLLKDKEDGEYQTNLLKIKFKALSKIENIEDELRKLLSVYLFDKENNLLENNLSFKEKLMAKWNVLLNEIEVYSETIDYSTCFFVENRKENEYELFIEQDIDTSVLGMQAISIVVYDKINNDYIVFNKAINVVDTTNPSIVFKEEIEIVDKEIDKFLVEDYVSIVDNYDENANIKFSYYDNLNNEIFNYNDFISYLKGNLGGKITFFGVDSSNNQTEVYTSKIKVLDTTSPTILKNVDEIKIIDKEIESFNINDYFEIKDNYDKNPTLIMKYYNSVTNEEINVNELMKNLIDGNIIYLEYYGIDNADNKTLKENIFVTLIDTTSPTIKCPSKLVLNDFEVSTEKINETIIITDNIDKNPKLEIEYYIDDLNVTEYNFIENIKKGATGYIIIYGVDISNNESEKIEQIIEVIDTTSPSITILDIKENGKYLKLETLNYEVTDNFIGNIDVVVLLNNEKYDGKNILEVGSYELKIIAKDESGNETIKILNFSIIENNIKGCGTDLNCYLDNYTPVIVIVTVLMISIIGLIVGKYIYSKKKKKTEITFDE